MLVLFETAAGYAIFKLLDEKKLVKAENLYHDFETPEAASRVVKLKHFEKFRDTTEALAATTAAVEGKLSKSLKKLLRKAVASAEATEQLLVADAKLGGAIKDKLQVACISNTAVQELMRCIRSQMDSLLAGLPQRELSAMALGLAHSLSRYKLKFSPDKVDTMIVQAVCLLDDLDKELNNYVMRTREWYGWHFPELGKLIPESIPYVKTIKVIGTREHAIDSDLSDILPEDVEEKVKQAAEISMGTEISEEDVINIQHLCDQVIDISNYRSQLYDYLRSRMMAMAPNLTVLVGELVGARLISHAGSLINLAKHPASTLQILGAEKALFRALKTKRDTPKYGLIYHTPLITQCKAKFKGKISRMLAAKAALATRFDALGEDSSGIELGAEHKVKIEARLRLLEAGSLRRISGTGKAAATFEKYYSKSEVRQYPVGDDNTMGIKRKAQIEEISNGDEGAEMLPPKKKKKLDQETEVKDESFGKSEVPKKKLKKSVTQADLADETATVVVDTPTSKKKKKKLKQENPEEVEYPRTSVTETTPQAKKTKKKKVKVEQESELVGEEQQTTTPAVLGSGKKKMKIKVETEVAETPKVKKKKPKQETEECEYEETITTPVSEKKKKKKMK